MRGRYDSRVPAANPSTDPALEYQERLEERTRRADTHEKAHHRLGDTRLLFLAALIVVAIVLCRSRASLGAVLLIMMVALFIGGRIHDGILNARDAARRAMRFYQGGLNRLNGTWAGKGSPGTEFLDPHHPYAADLDLFGPGSLFELLNTAQTQLGQATLASWLLKPAAAEEIQSRQGAIEELRPKLDLRERLSVTGADAKGWIPTAQLVNWAEQPRLLDSPAMRVLILCLPFITLGVFVSGRGAWAVPCLVAQAVIARFYAVRVRQVNRSIANAQSDFTRLAGMLACTEGEAFHSERLRRLDAECQCDGMPASQAIQRLARLYDALGSAANPIIILFCKWLMWETQFAFAIDAWRAQYGRYVPAWLKRLAEMEALTSLAGYAYEHPRDPFAEFLPAEPPRLEATGLGHPLIPEARCVRNEVRLGPDQRLIVISGSNMSGKSTYLRSIGINLVLAQAGAPVRAARLRLSPLQIGASIRTLDSLQEGTSRFYAEIRRIADIVKMAGTGATLVFLLDEILGGTNSHDRRIGAAGVARSLVARGAMGLITTHDLALTQLVQEINPPGANFHFEDQFQDGKMSFDYRLRLGVVEKSNALELMKSVGLATTSLPS